MCTPYGTEVWEITEPLQIFDKVAVGSFVERCGEATSSHAREAEVKKNVCCFVSAETGGSGPVPRIFVCGSAKASGPSAMLLVQDSGCNTSRTQGTI